MTKQTTTGQTVEITARGSRLTVTINGQIIGETDTYISKLTPAIQGHTHKVTVAGKVIALTTEQAATLQAEIDAQMTGEGTIEQREQLVIAMQIAGERQQEIMEQAVETGKLNQAADRTATAAYEQAVTDLATYDAAHPEIVAQIAARREANVRRAMTY
jgi:hypothetical protein